MIPLLAISFYVVAVFGILVWFEIATPPFNMGNFWSRF